MTFYDISKKMLIFNFHRYKLYFLCNVVSVALFYSFAAIFTNQLFMDGRMVDSIISSNIYAPSIFVGVFLVLFIPYSNHIFLRKRKYEYGILMTLGMSETEVLKNMLLESCVVAILSLISGLMLGTMISSVFYFIIQQVIGISGLRWYFNIDSYQCTTILYGVTVLFTLITSILGFIKMQFIDLIKEKFMMEKKDESFLGIFIIGVICVLVSMFIMIMGYKMCFISLVITFVGLYMIITHGESILQYFPKRLYEYRQRHIMEISFVRQHYKSRSRITILASWLMAFSIFFTSYSIILYPSLIHDALTYSPYDLVYSKIFGMNQVKDGKIENLLNQNGVSVKTIKNVEYLRDRAYNLLSLSEVNEKFKCHYQIPQGKFMMIFQYDLNDGYEHEMTLWKMLSLDCGDEKMQLNAIGSDVRILFNQNPTFADTTIILNDMDYSKIASKSQQFWKGIMKLYSFNNWKDSQKAIDAVQTYLLQKNQLEPSQQIYYRASSKIKVYTNAKQSAEFLIFMMFFVMVLFYGASNIMIYFKIKGEWEEEQRILYGLYKLGATKEEILRTIRYKNIYYYMPQVIMGIFVGAFYSYTSNQSYGYGWKSVGYSFFIGIILIIFQLVVVMKHSKKEISDLDIF